MKLIDSSTMQRVGGQLGSNPAAVFEDRNGQRYYVKTLESIAHARNEWIAARLYQLAGAPTLTYLRSKSPDQIVTQWVDLDKKCIAHLSVQERKQAQRWFGVHAWMANWDAAGYHGDNQGAVNGKVLTLDVGGALMFRAFGDPKGRNFATQVNELDILRNDAGNPHSMQLFSDMTATQIKQAIQVVVQISDSDIRRTIVANGGSEKLAEKMILRKADMHGRLRGLEG